ncbi:COG4 transport protein-domain-containing protein [Geopyxis carbonaria]|nr:COG4 transport protein-domain-containing protein [Geopyxis carbonaria]
MPSATTTTITASNGHLHLNDDDDDRPLPARPSVHTCTTTTELRAALSDLTTRDTALTTHLTTLLSTQSSLQHTLSRLDLLRAHLGTHTVSARTLTHSILSPPALTASRVSTAVRALDTAQSRVRATLAVVDQVAELKTCVLGVTGSMGAPQDWETAAAFLHRAAAIPADIVDGGFAEEMVPSAEVPDPPRVTLDTAAAALCALFLREFEAAAARADGEGVTRFFKLFPLIGRAQTGLEVYGRYVCSGVAERARREMGGERGDFFYSTAMTRLFEHIATIVEQHGALVERHYGAGQMGKVVERLQREADTQGGSVIDAFIDEKSIDRKLTDIKSYAFSFLVQSFLGAPRGPAVRTGSPAPGSAAAAQEEEEEGGVDVKEVDLLLTEMGVMLGRWSLYCRFLARKTQDPEAPPGGPLQLPPVITNSTLLSKIQDRLITPFTVMSTFFIRRSIEKAFQLDEAPSDLTLSLSSPVSTSSNPPFITSAVDDAMYIVSKLLTRALETSQRALVLSVVSTVSRVLGSDFIGMIQRKMRDESYPRPPVSGGAPPDDKVLSFLLLLNNLDTASDYCARIIASLDTADLFPFTDDAAAVAAALAGMRSAFDAKATELTADGVMVVFNAVVKPRLRPALAEAWRDVDYATDTVEDEGDGGGDAVRARFEAAWGALLRPLQRVLSEGVFARLHSTTAAYFARLLEKRIWGYSGRVGELGAGRLERDVAGVVGVVVRGGRYGVREVFSRCSQICLGANMDAEEYEEGGVEWVLDAAERRRAREMVVR